MADHAAGPIEKLRSIHVSRPGLAASAVATLAARNGWEARAQDSTPISYQDETLSPAPSMGPVRRISKPGMRRCGTRCR